MNVVRHDDEFVQLHMREMFRDFIPTSFDDFSPFTQFDHAIADDAKHFRKIICAHRDEIHARLGVIVPLQPDGPAVVA